MDRTDARHPNAEQSSVADLGLVDALAQLSFLIWGMSAKRASGHELSMIQVRLLGVLRDREPTMNELARLLDLDKSSVTGLVDRAETRDLVKRTTSPDDRRAFRVSLTGRGRRLIEAVAAEFRSEIEVLVACLSPTEQAQLSGNASRVVVSHATDQGLDILAVTSPA